MLGPPDRPPALDVLDNVSRYARHGKKCQKAARVLTALGVQWLQGMAEFSKRLSEVPTAAERAQS